jgi:hypothetical protein
LRASTRTYRANAVLHADARTRFVGTTTWVDGVLVLNDPPAREPQAVFGPRVNQQRDDEEVEGEPAPRDEPGEQRGGVREPRTALEPLGRDQRMWFATSSTACLTLVS